MPEQGIDRQSFRGAACGRLQGIRHNHGVKFFDPCSADLYNTQLRWEMFVNSPPSDNPDRGVLGCVPAGQTGLSISPGFRHVWFFEEEY